MAIRIKSCSCENQYQDEKYGRGLRLHNIGGTKPNETVRCSVCGTSSKDKTVAASPAAKTKGAKK